MGENVNNKYYKFLYFIYKICFRTYGTNVTLM